MKERAIIFDIDGTAIDSPKQKLPSKALTDSIDRAKQRYYLSAATGRVWSFVKPVLQGMHLTDPSIISAGTQICNPTTGEILWQKTIPQKSLGEVIEILKTNPGYKILYGDYTEDDYLENRGIYPQEFVEQGSVYFLNQIFVPDTKAVEVSDKLNRIEGVTCVMVSSQKSGCRDIHIVNKAATKEHAVAELLKILKVNKANSIGIGDSYNDVHLFNAVGYKVAVENSIPELKEVADKIIGSVKEDGMAKYLDTLSQD